MNDIEICDYKVIKINSSLIGLTSSNDLTSNFNFFSFEDYHWPFDLNWLFEIQADPELFQNPIWGLRYHFDKKIGLGNVCTAWLISTSRFSVGKLLLHHYKSDLAHLSDFDSPMTKLLKYERWAKLLKKWMTSSEHTKFAQFWVVSVRKWMVKRYLISECFSFLDVFFPVMFW